MPLPLFFPADPTAYIPDEAECTRLWDKYDMLPGVREHSSAVAGVALGMARKARERGFIVEESALRAAALLHDVAKTYTIRYGGSHAQLGAVWTRQETGNVQIAQAILYHVSWPWMEGELAPERNPLTLPFLLSYADKRVRHAEIVSLRDRFEDLLERYGKSEQRRSSIRLNYEQSQRIEAALTGVLGPLDTF